MTTSQFFVYKRPVAWTLLAATLAWGYFAYRAMPQRHDPIIPIRIATVVTIYPGADAEKVEREVTPEDRKASGVVRQRREGPLLEPAELLRSVRRVVRPREKHRASLARLARPAGIDDRPADDCRPPDPPATQQGLWRDGRADAHDLQSQGLRLRDPPAGGEHPRGGRRVPPRPAGAVSPRPAHGRARLSQHRGTLLRRLAGQQPLAAADRARADRRRSNRGSSQHRLPRFSTGRRQVGRGTDPRGPALGARHDRHGHVAPRYMARHSGPRSGRRWKQNSARILAIRWSGPIATATGNCAASPTPSATG